MAFNIRAFVNGHKVLVTFIVLAALLVGWWNYAFPSATWRYKMTVTVETPEGLKTGSAVRAIRQFTDFKIGDAGGGMAGAIGEAVVVDLGQRGKLFMTIGEDHYIIFKVFPFSQGGNTPAGIKYYSHLKNAKASIKNIAQQAVTFTNLNDPLTVKAVDLNDLSVTFGTGVTLKDITIETTDEQMTQGVIDNVLPWLVALNGGYLSGKHINGPELYEQLHGGNFKKGGR